MSVDIPKKTFATGRCGHLLSYLDPHTKCMLCRSGTCDFRHNFCKLCEKLPDKTLLALRKSTRDDLLQLRAENAHTMSPSTTDDKPGDRPFQPKCSPKARQMSLQSLIDATPAKQKKKKASATKCKKESTIVPNVVVNMDNNVVPQEVGYMNVAIPVSPVHNAKSVMDNTSPMHSTNDQDMHMGSARSTDLQPLGASAQASVSARIISCPGDRRINTIVGGRGRGAPALVSGAEFHKNMAQETLTRDVIEVAPPANIARAPALVQAPGTHYQHALNLPFTQTSGALNYYTPNVQAPVMHNINPYMRDNSGILRTSEYSDISGDEQDRVVHRDYIPGRADNMPNYRKRVYNQAIDDDVESSSSNHDMQPRPAKTRRHVKQRCPPTVGHVHKENRHPTRVSDDNVEADCDIINDNVTHRTGDGHSVNDVNDFIAKLTDCHVAERHRKRTLVKGMYDDMVEGVDYVTHDRILQASETTKTMRKHFNDVIRGADVPSRQNLEWTEAELSNMPPPGSSAKSSGLLNVNEWKFIGGNSTLHMINEPDPEGVPLASEQSGMYAEQKEQDKNLKYLEQDVNIAIAASSRTELASLAAMKLAMSYVKDEDYEDMMSELTPVLKVINNSVKKSCYHLTKQATNIRLMRRDIRLRKYKDCAKVNLRTMPIDASDILIGRKSVASSIVNEEPMMNTLMVNNQRSFHKPRPATTSYRGIPRQTRPLSLGRKPSVTLHGTNQGT